jgi:hypothetical protein
MAVQKVFANFGFVFSNRRSESIAGLISDFFTVSLYAFRRQIVTDI